MARFLVVDDDASALKALALLLAEDGHEVSSFTAGSDAVDALARAPFDAVVTDLEMPQVDGHAVVRAARERHPEACVVVMTARVEEAEKALAEGGACIVVDKPLDYDALARAVAECRLHGSPGARGR
jgi:DNA-binding NtrC family response regulator